MSAFFLSLPAWPFYVVVVWLLSLALWLHEVEAAKRR